MGWVVSLKGRLMWDMEKNRIGESQKGCWTVTRRLRITRTAAGVGDVDARNSNFNKIHGTQNKYFDPIDDGGSCFVWISCAAATYSSILSTVLKIL
jgi:hypothetical protein